MDLVLRSVARKNIGRYIFSRKRRSIWHSFLECKLERPCSVVTRRTHVLLGMDDRKCTSSSTSQLQYSADCCDRDRGIGETYGTLKERVAGADQFLLDRLPKLLREVYSSYRQRDRKVIEFLLPHGLASKIDFSLKDVPTDNEELSSLCEKVIQYSVKTGHPYFFNQLFNGVDPFALSGALLTETLNGSAYTYEIGPVHTFIEQEIINKVGKDLVGYQEVDGIFCPGGSICNMYALSLARYRRFPESKLQGLRGLPPVHIYTSELGHYSLKKASFFMGFGLDSLITVKTDALGRMISQELEAAIMNSKRLGVVPLMVNATAGTTVLGAYDPINDIADVCEKHEVWLHVDSCWGGAVLLSPALRHKMKGANRANSLAWDPHKMAGSILQCAMIITRHTGLMAEAHCSSARYLFQQDKIYDCSYDTGDKSIQCGRKMDALKLWVQWKAYGNVGMAERIEKCFDNARFLRDRLRETEGYTLIIDEPECLNICFWYIPPSLRGQEQTPEWWQKLSKVAPAIKGRMQVKGSMLVGYQPEGQRVNFFRMICSNPLTTHEDMQFVIDEISRLGCDL